MRIESGIKLDFKDVMFRPKRSKLKSRSEVSVERSMDFKHSGRSWRGVPVIAANMDTTGTFEMAKALSKRQVLTALHKHYTIDEWRSFVAENPDVLPYVAVSAGTSASDFERLQAILPMSGSFGVWALSYLKCCRINSFEQCVFV